MTEVDRRNGPKRGVNNRDNDREEDDYHQDPAKRIEMAIYELGDRASQRSVAEDIDEVAQLILKTGASCPDAVVGALVAGLLELPHKTDLIATLVGILNVANREIVALTLERLNSLQGEMQWWHMIQIPRIVVELTNCGVLEMKTLNSFFLYTTAEPMLSRSKQSCVAVLLALPWLSLEMQKSFSEYENVLKRLEDFITSAPNSGNLSVSYPEFDLFPEFSQNLMAAVKEGFSGRSEPYRAFESVFAGSLQPHDAFLPDWSEKNISKVSSIDSFAPLNLFPEVFEEFRASGQSFVSLYYQFMLHMLIEIYELNHRRGAEVLFSCLPESCKGSADKFICQVLLGKLIQSTGDHKVAYYEDLLIDCCRLSRMFPPMMARSLLKMVSGMNSNTDLMVLERLSSWFAHHLSHYDFKWNWSEWQSMAESKVISTQRLFLRLLIHHLLILSYHEKIQSALPEFMLALLPSSSLSPTPSERLNREFVEYLRNRLQPEEFKKHMESEGIQLEEAFEAVLQLGSKTFTHLLNACERYSAMFKGSPVEMQEKFIDVADAFWSNSSLHFHIVLEKMIHYGVLNADVVIDWLFRQVREKFEKLEESSLRIFEVDICLRLLKPKLLLTIIGRVNESESEAAKFTATVIARLDQLQSISCHQAHWLRWLVNCLVAFLVREVPSEFKDILSSQSFSTEIKNIIASDRL